MKIKTDYHGDIECICDDRSPDGHGFCCKVSLVCDQFMGWIEKDGLTHDQRMAPMKKYFAQMREVSK